ncbi:MAG: protease inhibitor I42 family protein [Candidatus Omnitrophica bacterium]|nr:protease inhibitor I42 family protein [Candidatus Omnitrophota bacterium]
MLKKRAIVVGITAIFILSINFFGFAEEGKDVRRSIIISAKAGKEFMITLESNMTTGYQWQLAEDVDGKFVVLKGSRYIVKETGLVGSGGKEEWVFKALRPGTTEIYFKYVRSWENNVPPADKKSFVVKIEKE